MVFQDLAEESAIVLDGLEGFLPKSLECGIGRSKDREVKMAATENSRETGLFDKRGEDGEIWIASGDFKQGGNPLEVGIKNLVDCVNHPVVRPKVGAGDDGLINPNGTIPSPEKAFDLHINAVFRKESFERAGFEITK